MVLISRTAQQKSGRSTDIYLNESRRKNQTWMSVKAREILQIVSL